MRPTDEKLIRTDPLDFPHVHWSTELQNALTSDGHITDSTCQYIESTIIDAKDSPSAQNPKPIPFDATNIFGSLMVGYR